MVKNQRKNVVFEGFEAPINGQVWRKMGPSWDKMVWGSELDGIFGHLRRKMAVKLEVRRKVLKNIRKTYVFNAIKAKKNLGESRKHSGDGGS